MFGSIRERCSINISLYVIRKRYRVCLEATYICGKICNWQCSVQYRGRKKEILGEKGEGETKGCYVGA
jgi:hypothetical protein